MLAPSWALVIVQFPSLLRILKVEFLDLLILVAILKNLVLDSTSLNQLTLLAPLLKVNLLIQSFIMMVLSFCLFSTVTACRCLARWVSAESFIEASRSSLANRTCLEEFPLAAARFLEKYITSLSFCWSLYIHYLYRKMKL